MMRVRIGLVVVGCNTLYMLYWIWERGFWYGMVMDDFRTRVL